VVRDAFAALGHNAWSCDLMPTRRPGQHWQGDVRDCNFAAFDLMIAHPPCTYLSVSGLHWNKRRPERAALTEEALEFVRFLMAVPVPLKAIENPVSCISTRIRPADQVIQPHQFGHDASKATCLWLDGLPPLVPTELVNPRWVCCGVPLDMDAAGKYGCANCHGDRKPLPRWANQTDSGQNKLGPSPTRQRDRSATYQGIADAMAAQWGGQVLAARAAA
jgi:hypothetical protein